MAPAGWSGQRRSHQHQHGGSGPGGRQIGGKLAHRGVDHLLVGPGCPDHDGRRRVRPVGAGLGQQLSLQLGGPGRRQEHGQGGSVGREGSHRLPWGHRRRRATGQPGQHHALGDGGDGELPPEGSGGRCQGADSGHHFELPLIGQAPVDLLLDGAVDGGIARVEAHDVGIRVLLVDGQDVLEGHDRRVVNLGVRTGVVEQGGRHERGGPHHQVSRAQSGRSPQGDQVGSTWSGTYEADHWLAWRRVGGTITVAR